MKAIETKILINEKQEEAIINTHELTIEKLFSDYDCEYEFSEFNWGEPKGAEVW